MTTLETLQKDKISSVRKTKKHGQAKHFVRTKATGCRKKVRNQIGFRADGSSTDITLFKDIRTRRQACQSSDCAPRRICA